MLVACRLAGLSALEGHYAGVRARNAADAIPDCGLGPDTPRRGWTWCIVRSSHEGPLYAPRPCATEDDARINAFEDQFLDVRSAPVACGRIFQ